MKAKKLTVLLLSLLCCIALCAFVSSADEVGPCEHGEEYWEWRTINQTCTSEGLSERYCTYEGCGKIIEREIIPAHNYKTIYIIKTPTCLEKGLEAVYCEWCNNIINREIPVSIFNHSWSEWEIVTDSTCVSDGVKTRYCTRPGCGATGEMVIPVDNTKHTETTWETVTPATCAVEGTEKSKCAVCGEYFERKIPVHSDYLTNPENYTVVKEVEANCNTVASKVYHCGLCLESFTIRGKKDPEKHDYTDESLWVYSENATCQAPGTLTKYCKNSKVHKIVEEYAPHDFSGEVISYTAPTCNTDGSKTVKCIYEGCEETKTFVLAAEHIPGQWTITSGSCAEGGTASRECPCGQVKETDVPFAAGTHLNYTVTDSRIPTCEYYGWEDYSCDICGAKGRRYTSDPLGHKPGNIEVVIEATCENSGLERRSCLVCGKVVSEKQTLQKTHSTIILKNGYEATCTQPGLTNFLYCTYCAKTFAQEAIPALGHNFVEQNTPEEGAVRICDRCYEYEISDITCKCLCHNSNGLAKTIYKIIVFFSKIFGINQECKCGIMHY